MVTNMWMSYFFYRKNGNQLNSVGIMTLNITNKVMNFRQAQDAFSFCIVSIFIEISDVHYPVNVLL